MVSYVNNLGAGMGIPPTWRHKKPAFPSKTASRSLWITMLETLYVHK